MKIKTLLRVRQARASGRIWEMFGKVILKNIPDRQKCVPFRKSQKRLNHSTLMVRMYGCNIEQLYTNCWIGIQCGYIWTRTAKIFCMALHFIQASLSITIFYYKSKDFVIWFLISSTVLYVSLELGFCTFGLAEIPS